MNKEKIRAALPGLLFVCGCVGVVATAVSSARDTLKAEKIIQEENIYRKHNEFLDEPNEDGFVKEVKEPLKVYIPKVVKATWKSYIPTAIVMGTTLTCLIASNRLNAKQVAALSTAVAGAGGLVTKYRNEIRDRFDEATLNDIDRAVASATMEEAKPPTVSTSRFASGENFDLSYDGDFLFFDPFTKVKFRSTKLAVTGARYYLNRNFSLGAEAPLSMFYAFLGLDLPEEYSYAGWDAENMSDSGYCWIDIDFVRSNAPDPETGEFYYIIEYDFLPGDSEDNYYPFGNPLESIGSVAV